MDYKLNLGAWGNVFAVPSCVVDNYIKLASGTSLKVLLYALRSADKGLCAKEIADALGLPEDDVADALTFWVQMGLFAQDGNVLSPAVQQAQPVVPKAILAVHREPVAANTKAEQAPLQSNVTRVSPDKSAVLSASDIAARLGQSEELSFLFRSVEQSFSRPLNHTEQRSLLSLHDWAGLPVDVILMAIEYCQSIDRMSIRSIETVATKWADMGINTHERAEVLIKELKQQNDVHRQIKATFGINRTLTPKERAFLDKWVTEYGFGFALIQLAYERTADNTGKLSFAYMNTILEAWHTKGIHTVEQANEEGNAYKRQTAVLQQAAANPSYNLDEFDKLGLKYTPKHS